MPRVNVDGIQDYVPDAKFDGKHEYLVSCTGAKIHESTGSLMLTLTVEDGVDFSDGSSPIGRVAIHFVSFDMSRCNEDWQRKNVLKSVNEALTAFGVELDGDSFDTDEFLNKTANANILTKKDSKGVERDSITALTPVAE